MAIERTIFTKHKIYITFTHVDKKMKEGNQQYCLTLELKDNDELIKQYEDYHQPDKVWPEVLDSIRSSGIQNMQIYRLGTLLVMLIEVDRSFSFESKAESDQKNPKVQKWEKLMEKFQKINVENNSQAKWKLMKKIFRV